MMRNIKHFLVLTGILTCLILSNRLTAVGKMTVDNSASCNAFYCCLSNPKTPPPVIVISGIPQRCVDGAFIFLNNYVTVDGSYKNGGIWRSKCPGLVYGDRVEPKIAGPGIWLVIYEYTDPQSQLSNKDSALLTINPLPKVFAGNDTMLCTENGKFALFGNPGNPPGVWRGTGISGSGLDYSFDPRSSGIMNGGSYPLIYRYTDNKGCVNEDTSYITVYRTPLYVEAGPDQNVGLDTSPVVMGGDPPGGIWTGPGIGSNHFYPSYVGIGTYRLVYTYTNVICSRSDSILMVVTPVSISESYAAESISILPNPAHLYTIVSIKGNYAKIESIKLSNTLGMKVLCFDKIINTDFQIINPGTEKGIYFLEIRLSDNRVIFKKIIFE